MTSGELLCEPIFLDLDDVLELHAMQLGVFGGGAGLRDRGLLSTLVFLDINGISLDDPSEALYVLTMGVAEGRTDKAAVTAELDRIVRSQV